MMPRAERNTINREFSSLDDFIHEYVTNVSTTGAFIRSKDPLPIGTLVNLRFTVILDELEVIEGVGEVVRVQEKPPGMGIVFRELTPASQQVIARLAPILLVKEAAKEPTRELPRQTAAVSDAPTLAIPRPVDEDAKTLIDAKRPPLPPAPPPPPLRRQAPSLRPPPPPPPRPIKKK